MDIMTLAAAKSYTDKKTANGGAVDLSNYYTKQEIDDTMLSKEDLTYITPQMFGAKGDGITDDSKAFQSAVDSGYNIFVPSGIYRVSGINIAESISIIGLGDVRLKVPDTIEIPSAEEYIENTCGFILNNATDVTIENIHFDGNYAYFEETYKYGIMANYVSFGIHIKSTNATINSNNVLIKKCKFDNMRSGGVRINPYSSNITVEDSVFHAEGWSGAFTTGIQAVQEKNNINYTNNAYYTFRNNKIFNCGEHGIVVYYGNNHCNILNNYIKDCGLQSVNPNGGTQFTRGACIKLTSCANVLIDGNYCENGRWGGIIVPNSDENIIADNIRIANNHIVGSLIEPYTSDGINIGVFAKRVVITNNVIEKIGTEEYLHSTAIRCECRESVISNNIIYDCDRGIVSTGETVVSSNLLKVEMNGIQITQKTDGTNGSDIIIYSNHIVGNGASDGILLYEINNGIIDGNRIDGFNRGIVGVNYIKNTSLYGNNITNTNSSIYWYEMAEEDLSVKVDFDIDSIIDEKLGVIENGTY